MYSRTHFAVAWSFCVFSFLSTETAQADQGDTLTIDPPATLSANNQTFSFGLRALQGGHDGIGQIWMSLKQGPWTDPNTNISLCTIHGDKAIADASNPPNESGPNPTFQCGRAYGMSVKIEGCKLKSQYHGYAHIDAPYTAYLGFAPIEVSFERKSANSGELHVSIWTAAGKVELEGKTTGAVVMPSCH